MACPDRRADGKHHVLIDATLPRADDINGQGSCVKLGMPRAVADACNGWTFWNIETSKGLRLIDELRAEIRSEMAAG